MGDTLQAPRAARISMEFNIPTLLLVATFAGGLVAWGVRVEEQTKAVLAEVAELKKRDVSDRVKALELEAGLFDKRLEAVEAAQAARRR